MYVASENLSIVGTPDDIAKEIAQRVKDGWSVDSAIPSGDIVHLNVSKRHEAPKEEPKK